MDYHVWVLSTSLFGSFLDWDSQRWQRHMRLALECRTLLSQALCRLFLTLHKISCTLPERCMLLRSLQSCSSCTAKCISVGLEEPECRYLTHAMIMIDLSSSRLSCTILSSLRLLRQARSVLHLVQRQLRHCHTLVALLKKPFRLQVPLAESIPCLGGNHLL